MEHSETAREFDHTRKDNVDFAPLVQSVGGVSKSRVRYVDTYCLVKQYFSNKEYDVKKYCVHIQSLSIVNHIIAIGYLVGLHCFAHHHRLTATKQKCIPTKIKQIKDLMNFPRPCL